jgi:hypothetical protein
MSPHHVRRRVDADRARRTAARLCTARAARSARDACARSAASSPSPLAWRLLLLASSAAVCVTLHINIHCDAISNDVVRTFTRVKVAENGDITVSREPPANAANILVEEFMVLGTHSMCYGASVAVEFGR